MSASRSGRIVAGIGCVILTLAAISPGAETIAPGVTYTFYDAPGPNRVYVVAADRLRSEYKLKIGWPQKRRNFTARQTVSTIVSHYDAPPGHDVLAAVNASFFGTPPEITGAAASDGEMLAQPGGSNETFLFGPTRLPIIREDIGHVNGTLTFPDGTSTTLHRYNRARATNTIVAYTPQWDTRTGTTGEGVEVVLTDVSYPMRSDKEIAGIVAAVRTGAASANNLIPAGGMVISAEGAPVATITSKVQVGQRLYMRFDTTDQRCNLADMSITGVGWLLRDGSAYTANWSQYAFSTERHPRTVLAWNAQHLFFMVCDGRCPGSVGMTFQEMAAFLTNTLGATDAVNLDGGGSSTMWVDGSVRNVPSDGCGNERAVANAVMLVREDTATQFPVIDAFTVGGRLPGWDDKFRYNPVEAFLPAAPNGDGFVVRVRDVAGGAETMRRGDFGDRDYAVEADIYCEYRPEVAGNGFERYCLFARDDGAGALGLNGGYGSGNCYALTYDSNNGRIRAGRYVNGALSDFRESSPVFMPSTAWRRFRIECVGSRIRYLVDGTLIADVIDTTHPRGYFGIGYHEFFASNSNMHGTRADNFRAVALVPPARATQPSPAHLARGVPLNAQLTWTAAETATSHNVYFGTTSPGTFQGNQTATTFDPGPLALHQTYYWRIDEVNEYDTTTGDVWQFTTQRYKGDFDDDGDVDQSDFGRFQVCLLGNFPQTEPTCERAKLTDDPYVNPADLQVFLACMSAPGAMPPDECLE